MWLWRVVFVGWMGCWVLGLDAQTPFYGTVTYSVSYLGPDSLAVKGLYPTALELRIAPGWATLRQVGGPTDTLVTVLDSAGRTYLADPRSRRYAEFPAPAPTHATPGLDTLDGYTAGPLMTVVLALDTLRWYVSASPADSLPLWLKAHPQAPVWANSGLLPLVILHQIELPAKGGKTPPVRPLFNFRRTAKLPVSEDLPPPTAGYTPVALKQLYLTAPY
ncbi:MAG: hypothetical protein SFY70_07530 [Bacteroidia bacterium]|nr:hypothetical protein [Bacteroidia bacterium]